MIVDGKIIFLKIVNASFVDVNGKCTQGYLALYLR